VGQVSQPITKLLKLLHSLRALAIEADAANYVLGLLTKAAVASLPALGPQLEQRFGWSGGQWTRTVDLQGLKSCLKKSLYENLGQLGSGSYGVVYRARNRETGEMLAIKRLAHPSHDNGLPDSTIREICILRELQHQNIVQ
jgi:hypothetical protein